MKRRYNYISEYYKEKFGERTLKICVDGGFTCPNRDGTIGTGGCIFCSEKGSGELINNANKSIDKSSINLVVEDISNQIHKYFESYRAERASKFIVYFQNYSNTYDSIENLRRKYDAALIDDRIIGISIATRPDCVNDEIVDLINSYTDKYYVCVELGFQTSNDLIGEKINRGYDTDLFINAVKQLKKHDVDVVAHIMCGLPFESRKEVNENDISYDSIKNGEKISSEIKDTLSLINSCDIDGIKIHSTYVVKNTKLEKMYTDGSYLPLSFEEYMYDLLYIISHINKKIIIHRICADAPKDILIAPEWNAHKKWILNGFEKYMKELNLNQGCFDQ